jgi:hypothetical protein
MLFEFGSFWQFIAILVASWCMFLIFDFEFTIVTLLAVMVAMYNR